MPEYRYELRRGDEVVATGHLTLEHVLEAGEPFAAERDPGIVRSVEPIVGERELRLVVEVSRLVGISS